MKLTAFSVITSAMSSSTQRAAFPPVMYPILLILAIGTAISIERYVTLTLMVNKNRAGWQKLEPLIMQGVVHQTWRLYLPISWS